MPDPAAEHDPTSQGPRVYAPPPFIYAVGFVLGYVAHRLAPIDALPPYVEFPAQVIGILLIAVAIILIASAALVFRRARTPIVPIRAATTLVIGGPYRFTRNPMYVAMTILYIGLSLTINMLWPLALLPIVLLTIDRYVIAREERHLRARFGEEYESYRQKVARWIGP